MNINRILVIGGYGFFGRRLVERLVRQAGLHITIAGRSKTLADALIAALPPATTTAIDSAAIDICAADFDSQLKRLSPGIVVNASGPFQGQNYRVAEACIAAGAHYIDLADGREFVSGISRLNDAALSADILVTSGASSVPALSSASVDRLAQGLRAIELIDIGISPGNHTERGLSTVKGILSYCGKALPPSAATRPVGWSGSYWHTYPHPVGARLLSPCDVPDLTLFPERYAGAPLVRFGAGLELAFLHRGMNLLAWLAQRGVVRDWSAHATWLKRAADLFQTWGTDSGAMHVTVKGASAEGHAVSREWNLMATHGDGPYVPTLAASALIRKIVRGGLTRSGAMPCVGLLTLDDFNHEMQGLHLHVSENPE